MQDGVYRVWLKGPQGDAAGAIAFRGGEILGCDGGYAVVGRYRIEFGQLEGAMTWTRLDGTRKNAAMPDLDEFHLHITGKAGAEFATLRATVLENPAHYISFELAWVFEA